MNVLTLTVVFSVVMDIANCCLCTVIRLLTDPGRISLNSCIQVQGAEF